MVHFLVASLRNIASSIPGLHQGDVVAGQVDKSQVGKPPTNAPASTQMTGFPRLSSNAVPCQLLLLLGLAVATRT